MTATDPWTAQAVAELAFAHGISADVPAPRATASQAVPVAVWCAAPHSLDPLILCRRLASHPGLHTSDGGDDWTETVRVSPPTTSNEETNRA